MNNKIGMLGSIINVITVAAFAVFMLIPFNFGSYFVCIFLAISFIMMTVSFENESDTNCKAAGKIASILAGIYAALIFIVYFTQCTSVIHDKLSDEALKILDYKNMGLMFNLDLLGYGIMALSTFFTGLTIKAKNKKDKALKLLLLIHGIFFLSCIIMPMTGMFANPDDPSSMAGVAALEFWCLYFIPIGILSFLHFREKK